MLALTGLSGLSSLMGSFSSPKSISELLVWLRSDVGLYQDVNKTTLVEYYDDPVGLWEDQSGNGNDVVQSTAGARPLFKPGFLNGYPAILFDGSNDFLRKTSLSRDDEFSLFIVFKKITQADFGYVISLASNNNNALQQTGTDGTYQLVGTSSQSFTGSPSDFWISSITFTASNSRLYINGTQAVSANIGVQADAGELTIGRSGTSGSALFSNVYVCEVIVYNKLLSTQERQSVENYLNNKYNAYSRLSSYANLPYTQLYGNLSSPTKLAFISDVNNIFLKRKDNIPSVRTTTYFFSQGGSDANAGNQAAPFRSLQKLNALASGSSGDVRFRLENGYKWLDPTGISIFKNNITLDNYGTASSGLPIISNFTNVPTTGWQGDSTNTWLRNESINVGALRFVSHPLTKIFIEATSIAECRNVFHSWAQVTGILYVNTSGVNPNTSAGYLEYAPSGNTAGVWLQGKGLRMENIQVEGYALDRHSNQDGVRIDTPASGEAYVNGIKAYYCGHNHVIGHHGVGSQDGGYAAFENVEYGFAKAGFGLFVSHSQGQHETLLFNSKAIGGAIPVGSGARNEAATPFYAHTAGPPKTISLLVIKNLVCVGGQSPWSLAGTSDVTDTVQSDRLSDIRAFIIGESGDSKMTLPFFLNYFGKTGMAHIGCRYEFAGLNTVSKAIAPSGFIINSAFDVSDSGIDALAFWQSNAGNVGARLWHNHVNYKNLETAIEHTAGLYYYNNPSGSSNEDIVNNIFSGTGTNNYNFGINYTNNNVRQRNNAYYGVTYPSGGQYGFAASKEPVALSALPQLLISPSSSSLLYNKGENIGLEYDFNFRKRAVVNIGPL